DSRRGAACIGARLPGSDLRQRWIPEIESVQEKRRDPGGHGRHSTPLDDQVRVLRVPCATATRWWNLGGILDSVAVDLRGRRSRQVRRGDRYCRILPEARHRYRFAQRPLGVWAPPTDDARHAELPQGRERGFSPLRRGVDAGELHLLRRWLQVLRGQD